MRSPDFNPRFPRGKRLSAHRSILDAVRRISIHASRVGSDLSRVPVFLFASISIHASRVGSDWVRPAGRAARAHFNPRFPRGKRLSTSATSCSHQIFQSTLPAWEATFSSRPETPFPAISIHASRVGSDFTSLRQRRELLQFQSTLPAWEATFAGLDLARSAVLFQSTLPAWEATSRSSSIRASCWHFNPRFPRGKRRRPSLFS